MRNLLFMFMLSCAAGVPAMEAQAGGRAGSPPRHPAAAGDKGVVVSGDAEATAAGIRILQAGGNAADAGAATLLALSVRTVGVFCIGGEVPMLIYDAKQKNVKVLGGQGEAPRDPKAIAWYLENGIPDGSVRAAPVPAVVDAAVTLLKGWGTKGFGEIVQPTLAILDKGGPTWYRASGQRIETGRNWHADLAVTLRKLVEAEEKAKGTREQRLEAVSDRFYRGDIADALEQWYIEKGGFLRKADLAAHKTHIEDPVKALYRGYTVYKVGAWTQGPYLLEALRLLEGFDLKKMGFLSADYIHVVTEAMKLGLADRDEYYGDPEFVKVPLEALLSDRYTNLRRPLIDMKRASLEIRPGDPYRMRAVTKPKYPADTHPGTTTMIVADGAGNVVTGTPSGLDSTAGVAGTTGIIHSTRLTSFNTWQGSPNVIAPGKRPRITLSPTLVFKDGKPVIAVAVAGGDLQDQAALELVLDRIDFGMQAEEALNAPRFSTAHHTSSFGQDKPKLGDLQVSALIDEAVQAELKARGHVVTPTKRPIAWPAFMVLDPATKTASAAGTAAAKVE